MIKSMTGFGRGEAQSHQKKFLVELKSLNHRYLDISIKMPKVFTYLEESIRQKIKEHAKRGRIEVYVNYENVGEADVKVIPDVLLANEYIKAFITLGKELEIDNDITLSSLVRFPEVIKIEKAEDDEDAIWKCMEEALLLAIQKLTEMRLNEGQQLMLDILHRLEIINDLLSDIEKRAPQVVVEYRQKMIDRMKELIDDSYNMDDNRIIMEAAIFADKSNVTEEIVRFNSHIKQFKKAMEDEDSIGRKLDFIIQEMNREVNTIGSKANDVFITNIVVNIKSELEKMREQVQNIE